MHPGSTAWRRIYNRPTSGDESAGFPQLIGVVREELAGVSKPPPSSLADPVSAVTEIVMGARSRLCLSVALQTKAERCVLLPGCRRM